MKRLRNTLFAAAALAAAALLTMAVRNDFGLSRNMEIMLSLMRELATSYVDEIDPDKLMADGAAGMVRSLDPYTVYLSEEEMTDFDFLTTGKYGGVGSLIRQRGEWVVFAQPYKDSPADRAGLKIGDRIVAIGGQDARGFTTAQVSERLKGDPGTTVVITVESLYTGQRREVKLRRERIAVPSIPYAGFVAPGIGYIQHSDFTEGSCEELRAAVETLRAEGPLDGLILDYRNNGGGILQEAVGILSLFLPRGTEVVATRGRHPSSEHSFRTSGEPLLPDVPIAVMINGNSASAAEIVAGALQDLDRAVLVGQKSFGKGLVQTNLPLGYGAFVKLTTAKYYIPSGRCIQAIDYSEHEGRGREVADSLVRSFRTLGGRTVYDGGGITPDVPTEPDYTSRFALTLYGMGLIDDYVDDYMKLHWRDTIDVRRFTITEADYDRFKAFMADKEVPYESASRRILKALKEAAEQDDFDHLGDRIAELEAEVRDDTQTNLETYRDDLVETLDGEIILRHAYAAGVVEHAAANDPEVARAAELLADTEAYRSLLAPGRDVHADKDADENDGAEATSATGDADDAASETRN